MKLIPVIDLMAGCAVWARPGGRAAYAPLTTSLCPDGDTLTLARRFAEDFGADTIYVADLDAITGRGDNRILLRALASALPQLQLWVDAGLKGRASVEAFTSDWPGCPVLGSETLAETEALRAVAADSAVLSLDYRGNELLGPPDLVRQRGLWPRDLILMSLTRVGARRGPDLDLLAHLTALAPGHRLFAAGGVRDETDLQSLYDAGAAGVLLASALHEGRVSASAALCYV